jgi:putative membrane protein
MDSPLLLAANLLIAAIALLHIYILVLEMFLWEKPAGLRAFRNTPEKAAATRVLAANQGLYNGFLAAGLLWGLWLGDAGVHIKIFFLQCIAIAGIYGGLTAARKIIFIQTLPAVLALGLLALVMVV